MPRVPPFSKEFSLDEEIKILSLQLSLEKMRASKINKLATKAKENKEARKSRSYYKAWSYRLSIVRTLEKHQKQLLSLQDKELKKLEKETKELLKLVCVKPTRSKKTKGFQLQASEASIVNELRQVC